MRDIYIERLEAAADFVRGESLSSIARVLCVYPWNGLSFEVFDKDSSHFTGVPFNWDFLINQRLNIGYFQ